MNLTRKIYVAGHTGLVGSALVRRLKEMGATNLVLRSHKELDLIDQNAVHNFFKSEKPDYVMIAAARVGGIHANSLYPVEFLYENTMIASNVIKASAETGVEKLLYLGSACAYPKEVPQPIKETALLTGPVEPTSEGTSLAKIFAIKLCEYYTTQYKRNFISAIGANSYGPGDNFSPEHSHVIPGMIRRFHEASRRKDPTVPIWGSGKALREFIFIDDLADAVLFLMKNYEQPETINIGTGFELSMKDLAEQVGQVVGYKGQITPDLSKPDGALRKALDSTKIRKMGWKSSVDFKSGLQKTFNWALENNQI